MIVPLISKLL